MHTTIQSDTNTAAEYSSALKQHAVENRNSVKSSTGACFILLDERVLERQCLAQCLSAHGVGKEIRAFGSIEEWRNEPDTPSASAILMNIGGHRITDPKIAGDVANLVSDFHPTPVVILADADELVQILKALEIGAKAYIPSSIRFEVCVEAVNLVVAGGTFVPASSVLALHKVIDTGGEVSRPMAGMFTERQEEVVRALRRGKANKIIAYELNLRESTVKVHIRNIMKKLKATNRTEVAYKLNEMFPPAPGMQS